MKKLFVVSIGPAFRPDSHADDGCNGMRTSAMFQLGRPFGRIVTNKLWQFALPLRWFQLGRPFGRIVTEMIGDKRTMLKKVSIGPAFRPDSHYFGW